MCCASTGLPLPAATSAFNNVKPLRTSAWLDAAMAGQNFNAEDRLDTVAFNRALWLGLKGGKALTSITRPPYVADAEDR